MYGQVENRVKTLLLSNTTEWSYGTHSLTRQIGLLYDQSG